VVIGGINMRTIPSFKGTGIDGLAVVSAIIGAPDIASAAREIKITFQAEGNGK
jgi:thiamine-phosphate pyrophosphorylase